MTTPPRPDAHGETRLALARRVADAHRGIDASSLLSFVSGSTVEGIADARSDVDMSVLFAALPEERLLRDACRTIGGEWFWSSGNVSEGLVVSFMLDGIEVQIGYNSEARFVADLDEVLVRHDPDTVNHKLAEGVLKGVPLAGAERFHALQQRLAAFPAPLARAMVERGLKPVVSWRGVSILLHRDAALWLREVQVDACYRLLQVLCGLNRRYFTRYQVKRTHRLAAALTIAPPALGDRIEELLHAPVRPGCVALHALEGDVVELVAVHMPDVDLARIRALREVFAP